jgi:starch-binding outer membrane protein, SusD/RagB family
MRNFKIESWPLRGRRLPLGAAILVLALAGCDTASLVELDDPDLITGTVARNPDNINELRNGAQWEFARALTGPAANNQTPGIVGISGLLADELWYASTFDSMQRIDQRNIIDATNLDVTRVFQYIHRARNLADRVGEQLASIGRQNSADAAMVTNLAGFSFIFFAENFCSGVPLSTTALTGDLEYGPPQTTEQLLDHATERFDRALAAATAAGTAAAAVQQQHLARVGLGRARLARGQFAEAAAAVAQVPTNFRYEVVYSENASSQNNGLWQNVNSERRSSAASGEGLNGLVFFRRGATGNTIDPRVSVDSVGVGLSTTVPFYRQNKYPTRGTNVPLATGIEARLIEAEAALNRGQSAAYLPILNTLRASVTGLAPLTDPGTPQARVRQLFEERAFWLWLTAHRLGDLRRMIRHYGFTQDQVFPVGQTIFGASYGTDVNFPIPFQETNNPQAPTGQCLNRDA